MIVLVLDPATSTGYCLVKLSNIVLPMNQPILNIIQPNNKIVLDLSKPLCSTMSSLSISTSSTQGLNISKPYPISPSISSNSIILPPTSTHNKNISLSLVRPIITSPRTSYTSPLVSLSLVSHSNISEEITSESIATIYEQGFIDVNTISEYQGDHSIDLMQKLEILIDKHKVEHIAIEDYFFSGKFANGSNVNVAYRTAIHILSRQKKIPYSILNISLWKKYVGGSTTPSKSQKDKWGVDAAKKLFIQEALYRKYGIKFSNHSLSSKTGNPIKFRNDIIDAVAQAVYFCYEQFGITKIRSTVKNRPDHTFNRIIKGLYVYPT